jgi:ketosteroid isomerase-like protein
MDADETVDALRRLWDAWSRGSVREIVALLDPGVTWSSVVLDRDFRGHDDVVAWLEGLRANWKSLTVMLERAEPAGPDRAVAYGRVRGFGYGGDSVLDTPMVWVAEFRDGLIVRGLVFTDPEAARRHLEEAVG